MAKFVWQPPGQEAMAFALRQERVAIGRDAGNDIRLPEPAVSARHAVVITRMGQSTVHDLNSSNGTWVNGKKVESQMLNHGDTVQFGRLSMKFVDEAQASSAPQSHNTRTDATPTVTLRPAAGARLGSTGIFPAQAAGQPPSPPQQAPDAPDFSELDRLLGSIRSFRDEEQKQNEEKRQELMAEWQKVISYCGALKTKLAIERRVKYFEVSERRNEVVVRVERAPGQPTQLIMVTWGHLDLRDRAQDGIWMRQPGSPDKRYEKCADVMRDLVANIAHLLA